jgi:hypothetical protein
MALSPTPPSSRCSPARGCTTSSPTGYIRDWLCLTRTWPPDRLLELAPVNWKQTLEQAETQHKLLANVFRRVALSPAA